MFHDTDSKQSTSEHKKTMRDLLIAHQASKRKRDEQDDRTLKEAVFSLISRHQNVDDLISEATRIQKNQTEASTVMPTVDGLYYALKTQADKTDSSLSSLTASLCCKKISSILKDKPADALLFSEDERALVIVLIRLIKKVQLYHGFNRNNFIKTLNKDNSLPIELVWRLHQDDIMTYYAYITCNLGRPNVIGALAQAVTQTCFCDPNCPTLTERKSIVKDIMTFLVGQGYTENPTEGTTSKGMRKVSTALLDTITKKFLSDDSAPPAICLHEAVLTPGSLLDLPVLQRYANRQITIILSHNPKLQVSDALRQQNNWTFAKTPSFMTDMYRHLLLVFSAEEVVRLVALTLEQQEVNWRSVLSFIATFLVVFSNAPRLLQELVTSLLQKAFDRCEMDSLILAFVLARQGALEGPHVFPAYSDWFQKTFGDSSRSPAKNKKSFGFLVKFLTDLVPHDEARMLKAHVLRPPAVPPKCHPLLADYIVLAKTRLEDLKKPLETTNVFDEGQTAADKEKVLKQADRDVEKAMAGFDKTGKVPASVMESSIFRKPYFIGRFLPALLKPRPLPDIPDGKMKFIEALTRADKIPTSMYNTYEKACRKESSHLLEGILSDEGESMEDLLLPPREQFENALSNLSEAVVKLHSEPRAKTGVASQISVLSEKVTAVLGTDPTTVPSKGVSIDITAPAYTKVLTEMAGSVLQMVCKVALGLSETTIQQGAWLRQVLAMLSRHPTLWSALLYQLWVLLTAQGCSLKPCHTCGLSAVVLHLTSDSTLSGNVTVKTPTGDGPYTDLVIQHIPCHTKRWMLFSLRFYSSYLDQAFRTFSEFSLFPDTPQQAVISPHIVKQFEYLVTRLCPESRLTEETDAPPPGDDTALYLTLYRSDQFRRLKTAARMSFSEWVSAELKVHCHDDVLSSWQRSDYSQWFVRHHIGEAFQACPEICRTIADAILDHDLRYEVQITNHPSCTCPSPAPGGDSRDHLLVLLQTLLPLLPPGVSLGKQTTETADVTDAVPWLRDVWRERKQRLEGDEYSIDRHAEKVAFLRLTRVLYPAFYFVQGK